MTSKKYDFAIECPLYKNKFKFAWLKVCHKNILFRKGFIYN